MDTETKMVIDCLNLFPEYVKILRGLYTVEEVEEWIFKHEKDLIRFDTHNDEWERIKFYAAVDFTQVFDWIRGEVYV